MYKCHLQIYMTGPACISFEAIKEMPSLENFTHIFLESSEPEKSLAAQTDVIIANLPDTDLQKALQILTSSKKEDAQVILLADQKQTQILLDLPASEHIFDIWPAPLSEAEARFRFLRWQQDMKMRKDFWQTSHYLEATINNIPNLVWYKDKNGIHEKVNDSFCRTVNKTKAQTEGRGHAYIWDVEQDDPACIESERKVMSKKQTLVSEETIQAGDSKRTLMTYKSPLYDLDGSVMGTVGVAIDVTQERAYEQEIIQKNQTLETIFSTIDCGMIRHAADGLRIISINRAALKILGYETQEELMADGFCLVANSVASEDKETLLNCIKTLKNPGDCVSTEYSVRHKNGDVLHVMGSIKLIEENGELFYQRFLLDCTAQKLQEMKNERLQQELVQALSIDYTLVCVIDPETGMLAPIRNQGRKPRHIFTEEIPLKESMNQYIMEYVHENDREMMQKAVSLDTLKKELEKQNMYYVNYRKRKNGETVYFQMKAVKARTGDDASGIVLGFHSVDEEIRREMEQNSLLEDALSQADKASKAKSAFLSNMSHDIRTPMNAIVGFTNLAIARIDQKEQVAGYLEKIMASGNHLLSLINNVLDMSRIESGKIHLEEAPCSLPDTVCGLRNILQADIHEKRLTLHIDTENIINEHIYCDKLRLNQVLLNLLGNSVKYTDPGGTIHMRITEKPGAPKGSANYEFSIKDNGIGMDKEFAKRIFEPFEREKNSTISGVQGTGLGMAITKNIVDMMNGSIKVLSEQGVGTEFIVSFTFRLHEPQKMPNTDSFPQASSQPDPSSEDSAALKADSNHGKRILLAEDVELNQEIATAILEDAGFVTEIADNGRIAVDMIRQSEPGYYQAVLMDIQMPVMNGYEAAREIRKLKDTALASLPILAMTANAFEEDRQEALRSGMNGHIAKPIDIQNLLDTLEQMLR